MRDYFTKGNGSCAVWKGLLELQNEKMYILTCVPNKDSNQSARLLHLIRAFIFHEETLHPWLSKNVPREDSDQTAWIRRLIWIFAGFTYPKVWFLALWLTLCYLFSSTRYPIISGYRQTFFAHWAYHFVNILFLQWQSTTLLGELFDFVIFATIYFDLNTLNNINAKHAG